MEEKNEDENETSSFFELTRYVGQGWMPYSVETDRMMESKEVLKQTITLSYVKIDDPPKGEEELKDESNVQIEVFNQK